jgi:hypothetical protein
LLVAVRISRSTQRSILLAAARGWPALDEVSLRRLLSSDPQALTVAARSSTAKKTRTLRLYDDLSKTQPPSASSSSSSGWNLGGSTGVRYL